MAKREYTVEEIRDKLTHNTVWVHRAMVALYKCQTEDEQMSDTTKHRNGMGFTAFDAKILSSFARQIDRGRPLTGKQLAIASKKVTKYAKQLHRIAYGQQTGAAA